MLNSDVSIGIRLRNGQVIRWGSKIGGLIKEHKPDKRIDGQQLTLFWGDVRLFGVLFGASSVFFKGEILVKDRPLGEIQLKSPGKVDGKNIEKIYLGLTEQFGDPISKQAMGTYSAHTWQHKDITIEFSHRNNGEKTEVLICKPAHLKKNSIK